MEKEELIEEIEYLGTENKELHMKVKDVCARNAEIKLNLIALQNRQTMAGEKRDLSAILARGPDDQMPDASAIQTAKDLDEKMFAKINVGGDGNQNDDDDDGIVEANNTFLSDNEFVEQMDDKSNYNTLDLQSKLQEADMLII